MNNLWLINEGFQAFLESEWAAGYREARLGLPYSGSTFYGYYGWLEGSKKS